MAGTVLSPFYLFFSFFSLTLRRDDYPRSELDIDEEVRKRKSDYNREIVQSGPSRRRSNLRPPSPFLLPLFPPSFLTPLVSKPVEIYMIERKAPSDATWIMVKAGSGSLSSSSPLRCVLLSSPSLFFLSIPARPGRSRRWDFASTVQRE